MKSPADQVDELQQDLWREFPALRPAAARPIPEAGRIVVGRDKHGVPFTLGRRLLAAHLDLLGGIGAGKTTLMRQLAWGHMESPVRLNRALVAIDPHGTHPDSFMRTTLRRIVQTKLYERKKVYVVDPNSAWATGLKLLTGDAVPSVLADHMLEGFERMQGDESLLEKPTLRRALHGLLAVLAELGLTLAEADLLLDPADPHGLRQWALGRVKDRYAKKAIERLQYLASDARLAKELQIELVGVENRLATLLSSPAMRAIVGMQMLDMREVFDEGAIVLVNTAGSDAASETAGDLLGKLVMRCVVYAAKRRRTNSLALVCADECARYVSQDWERALAELRKFGVGLCTAHQNYAMLGKPDDPVRQAVEQIPATKIVMRMNSMREAAELAPELVKFNLEMPVAALTKPAVVDYRRTWLGTESSGVSSGRSTGESTALTNSESIERTDSTATSKGTQQTTTHSSSMTLSEGETEEESWGTSATDNENWGVSHTAGENWGASATDSVNWGATDTASESQGEIYTAGRVSGLARAESRSTSSADVAARTWGRSSSRSGSTATSDSCGTSESSARAFDRANLDKMENVGLIAGAQEPEPHSGVESTGNNARTTRGASAGWNQSESAGESSSRATGKSHSLSDTVSEAYSSSFADTVSRGRSRAMSSGGAHSLASSRGGSRSSGTTHGGGRSAGASHGIGRSYTRGVALTEGVSEAYGISESQTLGRSVGHGSSRGTTRGTTSEVSTGVSSTRGRSEALEPILKDMVGAVHSLENVRHMTAEMLCTLPDGVAVIRTIVDGRIEGAVVRVPWRDINPVGDAEYAADVRVIAERNGAKPMHEAIREVDQRETRIIGEASSEEIEPEAEPEDFRVPRRTAPALSSHGRPTLAATQPVKGDNRQRRRPTGRL